MNKLLLLLLFWRANQITTLLPETIWNQVKMKVTSFGFGHENQTPLDVLQKHKLKAALVLVRNDIEKSKH